jgi:hypothetical protein
MCSLISHHKHKFRKWKNFDFMRVQNYSYPTDLSTVVILYDPTAVFHTFEANCFLFHSNRNNFCNAYYIYGIAIDYKYRRFKEVSLVDG